MASELAAHVRAGRTLAQALGDVAADLPEPIRSAVRDADAAVRLGAAPAEALGLIGGDGADILAVAVGAQLRAGGDLAALLDGLSEALVEREAQRRTAAMLTAQARATARMVAAMPAVAVCALAVLDRSAFSALVGSPLGLAALAVSAVLTLLGLSLVRRLAAVAA
ncbi:MAG TPA: type II secretion system F family protein [Gaiellales bacterium]|jgi:tight adherence protein B|nr:type II secretion system F family protein [Gaiellales bacterium]